MTAVSRRQERENAKLYGMRQRPASGAIPGLKGDLIGGAPNDGWLHENKTTKAGQLTLRAAVWEKIFVEASRSGRKPALDVHVGEFDLVVISRDDFMALRGEE